MSLRAQWHAARIQRQHEVLERKQLVAEYREETRSQQQEVWQEEEQKRKAYVLWLKNYVWGTTPTTEQGEQTKVKQRSLVKALPRNRLQLRARDRVEAQPQSPIRARDRAKVQQLTSLPPETKPLRLTKLLLGNLSLIKLAITIRAPSTAALGRLQNQKIPAFLKIHPLPPIEASINYSKD